MRSSSRPAREKLIPPQRQHYSAAANGHSQEYAPTAAHGIALDRSNSSFPTHVATADQRACRVPSESRSVVQSSKMVVAWCPVAKEPPGALLIAPGADPAEVPFWSSAVTSFVSSGARQSAVAGTAFLKPDSQGKVPASGSFAATSMDLSAARFLAAKAIVTSNAPRTTQMASGERRFLVLPDMTISQVEMIMIGSKNSQKGCVICHLFLPERITLSGTEVCWTSDRKIR
jgi:hypothetical protein